MNFVIQSDKFVKQLLLNGFKVLHLMLESELAGPMDILGVNGGDGKKVGHGGNGKTKGRSPDIQWKRRSTCH